MDSHFFKIFCWLLLVLCNSFEEVDGRQCPGNKKEGHYWHHSPCRLCWCHNGISKCQSLCKPKDHRGLEILRKINTETSNSNNEKINESTSTGTKVNSCFHDNKERGHLESWVELSQHSNTLQKNKECMMCHCNSRIVTCTVRFCPPINCKHPIRKEGSCCMHCPSDSEVIDSKGCSNFGATFKLNSTWKVYVPKVEKSCLICSCLDHCRPVCSRLHCPVLKCKEKVIKPGHCCSVCQDSTTADAGLTLYHTNSNEKVLNHLKKTTARKRSTRGTLCEKSQLKREMKAKMSQRSIIVKKKDDKNPSDCDLGKIYKNGERFTPDGFPCVRCICKESKPKCKKVVCPSSLPCMNSRTEDGLCCKVCPGTSKEQARLLEETYVQSIRRRCDFKKKKESRIQVFRYQPKDVETVDSKLCRVYLFDVTRLSSNITSEMHHLELHLDYKISVTIQQPIDNIIMTSSLEWLYIGTIKLKFLHKIHRIEKDIKSTQSEKRLRSLISNIEEKSKRGVRCIRNLDDGYDGDGEEQHYDTPMQLQHLPTKTILESLKELK